MPRWSLEGSPRGLPSAPLFGVPETGSRRRSGAESISATIPTSGGPQKLTFPVKESVLAPATKRAIHSWGRLPFAYYLTQADCISSPVTEVFFTGRGVLKS